MSRTYVLHRQPTVAGSQIDFAAELNEQQYAAVTAPPGPTLVIAGAGSGKTRTLTYRVAYLVENGVPPSGILLLTFTNKAAREMLDRVAAILPHDISGLWGGTFHSVGNRILRRHAKAAGFAQGFSIMDREDQVDLIDSVIASSGVESAGSLFPKGEVVSEILSFALNTGRDIESVLVEKHPHFLEHASAIEKIRKGYEERKRSANSMDFDDLLEKPLQTLRRESQLAEQYQRQFQFILVDEYQDTNHLQSDFIDILAARHRNVMVVGDDAQAIYSWRGADFRNILEFEKRYPGATIFKIETNYRSTPEILDVANCAIAANIHQYPKELVSARKSGMRPAFVPLQESVQQAQFVAQRIVELREEGIDLNEIAVLYRAHFHSLEMQLEFTRAGIPFQITSGLRFFEQAHIKDVAAFIKFVVNPRDEVAFKRMVRLLPGIGAKSAEGLWTQIAERLPAETLPVGDEPAPAPVASFRVLLEDLRVPKKSAKLWQQLAETLEEIAPSGQPTAPADMLSIVMEAIYEDYARANFSNYEQRREDLNTLTNYARGFDSVAAFLDQLALVSNVDEALPSEETEMVTLSTVHQAKGLEWQVVFVIFLAEGMFPSGRSYETMENLEEERRLFYVAVTRAKDELYLTVPSIRMAAGSGDRWLKPSRFLGEIPEPLVETWQVSGSYY